MKEERKIVRYKFRLPNVCIVETLLKDNKNILWELYSVKKTFKRSDFSGLLWVF